MLIYGAQTLRGGGNKPDEWEDDKSQSVGWGGTTQILGARTLAFRDSLQAM